MRIIEVTIHTMETLNGEKVEYARIVHKNENRILCRSVMLHKLSPDERAIAIRV